MFRRFAATVVLTLVLPATAFAEGGDYAFDGATPAERATVRAALNASAFDWDIVPQRVTIHVARIGTSYAQPGHIWLDRGLLGAGRFAWASVMDEYAHQVDFTVLDPLTRSILQRRLGASAWCYEIAGLAHGSYGCERFSSMVAWAYWPSQESSYRPRSASDETAAMPACEFRRLLAALVGVPSTLTRPG